MRRIFPLLAGLGLLLFLNPQPGLSAEGSAQDQGIVAVVNGKAIAAKALDEPRDDEIYAREQQISELRKKGLDEPVRRQEIYELEQRIFERKQKRLDEVIGQQLLDEEAAKRGMSGEEVLAKKAYSAVPAVTEEQVEKFYERYKHNLVQRPAAELKEKGQENLGEISPDQREAEVHRVVEWLRRVFRRSSPHLSSDSRSLWRE